MVEMASPSRASVPDTLKILAQVIIPTFAKGPIIRRPAMVALAERLGLDTRAVHRMQALRKTYGPGPLYLPVPFISRAMVLDPAHVRDILDRTPDPFTPDSDEKHGALSHLQPKGSLISRGEERTVRREFNERALQTDRSVHDHGRRFADVVNEEAASLLDGVGKDGKLAWEPFFDAWFRVVRRVTFGDVARDDTELTDISFQLRRDGNWVFFRKNDDLRERFLTMLQDRIETAEPGSLAGMIRDIPNAGDADPEHQVPQWLFAFDPAGMTTFRSLALLATHPDAMARARREIRDDGTSRQHLPFLRATVLESLRLWPTTPLVLRQSTTETEWENGTLPPETGLIIYAPYFHRDDQRLPFAHRFTPETWDDGKTASDWPLIPFSDGPGICPGRHVVLLTTTAFLAAIIDRYDVTLTSRQRLGPNADLPGTLNNYGLRFRLSPLA